MSGNTGPELLPRCEYVSSHFQDGNKGESAGGEILGLFAVSGEWDCGCLANTLSRWDRVRILQGKPQSFDWTATLL